MTKVVTPWALSGALVLAACATGQSRFRVTNIWPPPGLTEAQADDEIDFCRRAASKAAIYVNAPVRNDERADLAYIGCLGGFHFTLRLPNGAIISPSPQSQSASTSASSPSLQRFSPSSGATTTAQSNSSAAAHFRRVVEANEDIIFLAAHPSAQIDGRSVAVLRSDLDSAVIIYKVTWRGPRGKSFETTLDFSITYDDEGTINSVDIGVEETNNPFPRAFLFAEAAKQAMVLYAREKMRGAASRVAVSIVNSNTSVQGGVAKLLEYLTNNPDGN